MLILGISCSPRNNGNTEIMINEALKTVRETGVDTDIFLLSQHKVAPCDSCGGCFKTSHCVINDDMQLLYEKMIKADGIIFGTPVYFGNVSAQAKAVIDRTFALFGKWSLQNKVAGSLVVTRRVGAIQTRSLINEFFTAHGMIIVKGAIGYGREPGEVLTGVGAGIKATALDEARQVGRSVAQLVQKLNH